MNTLSVGERVKFAAPLNDDERLERFTVLELRGDRVLVAAIGTRFSIVPTFVYPVVDLVRT